MDDKGSKMVQNPLRGTKRENAAVDSHHLSNCHTAAKFRIVMKWLNERLG